MVKVLILLSAITLGQMSLAQSDSEDESDAPCVQFENTEYKKKPGCLCLSARAPIANQEKASHQNGKIQPRFSLSILPKREMSSPRTPSS